MKTNNKFSLTARIPAAPVFIERIGIRWMPVIASVALLVFTATQLLAQDDKDKDDKRPFLPASVRVVSTIPANGDLNPYGVATVPNEFPAGGKINSGDILVSNFNNSSNAQGTGTTIVRLQASGPSTLFSRERLHWD